MKLYGIANCTTVKKARVWLAEHGKDVVFHDFKKSGIAAEQLDGWISQIGWESLINRQGTTWRKLDPEAQAAIADAASAKVLMLSTPSIIKRPVLEMNGKIHVGFKPEIYENLFR